MPFLFTVAVAVGKITSTHEAPAARLPGGGDLVWGLETGLSEEQTMEEGAFVVPSESGAEGQGSQVEVQEESPAGQPVVEREAAAAIQKTQYR